ncbi:GntR family transcriptional regulator, partial [Streptomyces boluensis]
MGARCKDGADEGGERVTGGTAEVYTAAAASADSGSPAYGSDFLQLDAADVPVGAKADWLARRLRQAIADGRLAVGSRLPATRVLAAELRVSRGVVTEAYRRLTEDGHVEG